MTSTDVPPKAFQDRAERSAETEAAILSAARGLRQVASATDAPVSRAEWLALADAAETGGKERYVVEARRQAEAVEE